MEAYCKKHTTEQFETMAIVIRLDVLLAEKKIKSLELAEILGLTPVAISRMKTGKIKAIRLETMNALCKVFDCQPGDIFEYVPDEKVDGLFELGELEDSP